MKNENVPAAELSETTNMPTVEEVSSHEKALVNRRSFMRHSLVAGAAATVGAGILANSNFAVAQGASGKLAKGDVAILQFLAAAEIIESDLWLQYQELGGVQDNEVSLLASKLIPGYPATPTGGNPIYMQDLLPLDGDMAQYIHDNTEDELTHEVFINAYLTSKGADTVNLDHFRTLPSRRATGAQQIGRLTNLMQLTVDTSWWTKYRSRTKNPDFGDMFAQAVAGLSKGQFPAIPRNDTDLTPPKHIQAIANTAGFHFTFIEQGGNSLYPSLA